jgi:hypothetical protein
MDYTVNFITFGAGNGDIVDASKRLVQQAKSIGLFDNVTLFNEDSLRNDTEFWPKHGEFILSNSRGYGYWLWKPYIIKKTMDSLNDGDRLMYLDGGCEISTDKKEAFKYYIEHLIKQEIMISASYAGLECIWNKMDLVKYINAPETDIIQRQACATLFYVCERTRSLVNEWYEIASIYHFIDDSPSVLANCDNFEEHRHDQSVFSLLSKKYGFCMNYITDNIVYILRNRTGTAVFPVIENTFPLLVYKSKYKKIRLGSDNDGGYVISDIPIKYDCLISCGISNDITFEKSFCMKYPDVKIIGFDGTIECLPEECDSITFIKKNITPYNSPLTTNLHDLIPSYDNIFLKMDIETYEFRWLQTLTVEQLNKFTQIVIEFHFPFNEPGFTHLDEPLPVPEKMFTLTKLAATHTLVHLHANNCCGTTVYENMVVPNVFECTYVRKDIQNGGRFNTDTIPSSLDRPNLLNMPDITLSYPFVN